MDYMYLQPHITFTLATHIISPHFPYQAILSQIKMEGQRNLLMIMSYG